MTKKPKEHKPVPFYAWVLASSPKLEDAVGPLHESEEAASQWRKRQGASGRHLSGYKALVILEEVTFGPEEHKSTPKPADIDIMLFADGSVSKNPGGTGGWASIVVWEEDGERREQELTAIDPPPSTNNRAEMLGIIHGLHWIKEKFGSWKRIEVVSDSEYVLKGASEWMDSWKKRNWLKSDGTDVANRALWEELALAMSGQVIRWVHVKGHSGHTENERCDQLAGAVVKAFVAQSVSN